MAIWKCDSCGGENPQGMRFCGHCGAQAEAALATPAHAEPEHDVAETLRSFVAGPVAERLIEAGGEIPEERRLITALFADVSGFTSLADRLDPEQLLEVIDPVIAGLSSVVGRYEGYVEKFAGDALLALFGAPVSHEDDAERALRVALEMHRELARLCEELPHEAELTLHVGVNSGHAIARILGSEARMDYAVLGDSVILAQRLESAAPPGETYVSELTMRLAEDRFEFEPVGKLTLKGKAKPVPAWRLLSERGDAGRRRAASPLVGREEELAQAAGVIASVATGTGTVLTVTGEPGIGKSRLTAEVREQALLQGSRWLQTRCLSYGGSHAYWPYAELLRDFAGIQADDRPTLAAEKLGSSLADTGVSEARPYFGRLLGLPVDDSEVATLEPQAFRRGLHEAFASWARALARAQPLILEIEDVHWGDSSTLALTTELSRLCASEPLVLYLIARPEAETVLGEIAPLRRAISLEPLQEEGVATLIEAVLGGPTPPELSEFVVGRTAGNPFFVEELIRSLQDGGVLARENGGWRIRPGWDAQAVPPTIEGVLAARIDLLDTAAASVLQTASVIGRRVRIPLLTVVADRPKVEATLPQLVAGKFLDETEADGEAILVFHHALVQDVAYSRLLRRRRRDLHRLVAEKAEQLYGAGDDVVDLLARHLYLGEAGSKAVAYLVRAGERAKRLFANEEAILHFSRAAELDPEDVDIRLELADLHELVGSYEDALELYEVVRDSTSDIRAWAGITSTLRKRGDYERALAAVHEAFQTEGLKGEDLTPLWLEQSWTLAVLGRFEQAVDVAEAGLEAAGGRRDRTVGQLLLQLTRAETIQGHFDAAVEHGRQAVDIFESTEDLRGLATALRALGDAYTQGGRLDEAVAALRRGLILAERTGAVEDIAACLTNLGWAEFERGSREEAVAQTRRAVEHWETIGHGSGRARGYANLAHLLAEGSEYEEALEWCERALEMSRAIGHSLTIADVYDTFARIHLRREEFSEAAARAEEAATLYLELSASPQAAGSLAVAAEAWEKSGEDERARDSRARARELVPS
jgi:adenylate cyclase